MSGFYPVLGLLAVAVCISFPKVAAFPFIVNGQPSADKLHESNSEKLLTATKPNIAHARILNKNSKHASLQEDKNQQDGNVIVSRKYNHRVSGFGDLTNLRVAGENALRRQFAAADSASGNIADESIERSALVKSQESTQEEYSHSALSDDAEERNHENKSDDDSLGISVSSSQQDCEDEDHTRPDYPNEETTGPNNVKEQEDCEDEDHTRPDYPNEETTGPNNVKEANSTSTPSSTVESSTDPNTRMNTSKEDCSDEETEHSKPDGKTGSPNNDEGAASTSNTAPPPTEDSNLHQDTSPNTPQNSSEEECEDSETNSGGSSTDTSNGSQESEEPKRDECDETDETKDVVTSTAATPPKKPAKRPADENASSGSIGQGTSEDAQDFGGSSSEENPGDITNVRWKR